MILKCGLCFRDDFRRHFKGRILENRIGKPKDGFLRFASHPYEFMKT